MSDRGRRVTLLALAVVLLSARPAAPSGGKSGPKPKATPGPSPEEVLAAWQAYTTPGPPHEKLASLAGSWTARTKVVLEPGGKPDESEGTWESKVVLGGRYLEDRYEGTLMGRPFRGIGLTGYDNARKRFLAFWVDDAGTGMLLLEGTLDSTGTRLTMEGKMDDPVTGKPVRLRAVTTFLDADHNDYELWRSGPGGRPWKAMEIRYTRKK